LLKEPLKPMVCQWIAKTEETGIGQSLIWNWKVLDYFTGEASFYIRNVKTCI